MIGTLSVVVREEVATESIVISAVMLSVDGDEAIVPSVIGIVMALQSPCTVSGIAIGNLNFNVVWVRSTTASWNGYTSSVLDKPCDLTSPCVNVHKHIRGGKSEDGCKN